MKLFYPLPIRDIRRETADAVSLAFDVPEALREEFRFTQGQYLTFRHEVDGEELRRCYSICAGVDDGELRIAVKAVAGGRFSTFANAALSVGDVLHVFPPLGDFHTELDPAASRRYVAFAGGSGVTPILSLVKTTLAREPTSSFSIFYGNRDSRSIIFMEELAALKDRFLDRLAVTHILSEDVQEIDLFNGQLDREKCNEIVSAIPRLDDVHAFFICGPALMMDAAEAALVDAGVGKDRILIERFSSDGPSASVDPVAPPSAARRAVAEDALARVSAVIDGRRIEFGFGPADASVLEAGHAAGAPLPFACKGGVCGACRARVLEGEAEMKVNYALEEDEVAAGHILTCQAVPRSETLVVSFDE